MRICLLLAAGLLWLTPAQAEQKDNVVACFRARTMTDEMIATCKAAQAEVTPECSKKDWGACRTAGQLFHKFEGSRDWAKAIKYYKRAKRFLKRECKRKKMLPGRCEAQEQQINELLAAVEKKPKLNDAGFAEERRKVGERLAARRARLLKKEQQQRAVSRSAKRTNTSYTLLQCRANILDCAIRATGSGCSGVYKCNGHGGFDTLGRALSAANYAWYIGKTQNLPPHRKAVSMLPLAIQGTPEFIVAEAALTFSENQAQKSDPEPWKRYAAALERAARLTQSHMKGLRRAALNVHLAGIPATSSPASKGVRRPFRPFKKVNPRGYNEEQQRKRDATRCAEAALVGVKLEDCSH